MPKKGSNKCSIEILKKTRIRLKGLKIYPKESYDEIINKLADGAQGKSAWRTN